MRSLLLTVLSTYFVQSQAHALEINCVDPIKKTTVTITSTGIAARDIGSIKIIEKNSPIPLSSFHITGAEYDAGFLIVRAWDANGAKAWVELRIGLSAKTQSSMLWTSAGRIYEPFSLSCF
ncbi:MAG: hypothetical protein ABL927_13080 [Bdellovibrionales bacterium]